MIILYRGTEDSENQHFTKMLSERAIRYNKD
jgi:hypothetical protein